MTSCAKTLYGPCTLTRAHVVINFVPRVALRWVLPKFSMVSYFSGGGQEGAASQGALFLLSIEVEF